MDPALALPSYKIYRGSLVALLIGSIFAIWLLVLPPAGADRDAPPSSLAGVLPTQSAATASPTAGPSLTPSPTATGTEPTGTSTATPTAAATSAPTATAVSSLKYTVQPGDTLYGIALKFVPPDTDITDFIDQIQRVNNITDPLSLQSGDVVEIPRP
jgi:LysM repeat protein